MNDSNERWPHDCVILRWVSLPLEGSPCQGTGKLSTGDRRQAEKASCVLKWCGIGNDGTASDAGLQMWACARPRPWNIHSVSVYWGPIMYQVGARAGGVKVSKREAADPGGCVMGLPQECWGGSGPPVWVGWEVVWPWEEVLCLCSRKNRHHTLWIADNHNVGWIDK